MKIKLTHTNATEGYMFHEEVLDLDDMSYTLDPDSTPGEIYRECLKQFGRCTSKVYISADPEGSVNHHVGWYFEKREKYDDSDETFLRGTWVTLYDEHREEPIRKHHVISTA